jgi:hypothetical protein
MKKIALILILALGELLFPGRARAQDDYAIFSAAAGKASLLYRGHKAFEYNIIYNGTYYWYGPDFNQGELIYGEKVYRDIALNIDAARQELIVRIPEGLSDKALSREFVRECSFGGNRYLNLQYTMGEAAPAGFWEVRYDGPSQILRQVSKKLEDDTDGRKRDAMEFEGEYRLDAYRIFTYSADYLYRSPQGKLVPVKRRSDMLKLVDKSKRRELRRSIRQLESAGMLPFEQFCLVVARYIDTQ